MENKKSKKFRWAAIACALVLIGLTYYYFFSAFSAKDEVVYVYIDKDDNVDSVYQKLKPIATEHGMAGLKTLIRHSSYDKNIRTGRYKIKPSSMIFKVFRDLKNGQQAPVSLVIPSVRTVEKLSAELSKHLMLDSIEIINALKNEALCRKFGYDTTTIACIFIPNTYDVYWNVSAEKFLERMNSESKTFWNETRKQKAKKLNLTPNEVIILASIVEEETANTKEKPMVAGMYYKRLTMRTAQYPNGMPLQADPTIKFAWKRFELKRIYNNHLAIESPYNTYRNTGLPPGPIRIPSIEGIDAVLNLVHHNYIYMCAKEDFSGTHNFAETYEEHLQNAAKYTNALNKRGIK